MNKCIAAGRYLALALLVLVFGCFQAGPKQPMSDNETIVAENQAKAENEPIRPVELAPVKERSPSSGLDETPGKKSGTQRIFVPKKEFPKLRRQHREFYDLHAMIAPHKDEAVWASIPWETNLWEARKKAANEGKPLFLWGANADPIGCT